MVHALANPPPPPPAKTYHRHLAPQLIEKVKDGDIPEMKRLLDMVRRHRHTTTSHPPYIRCASLQPSQKHMGWLAARRLDPTGGKIQRHL
eukprot:COSAG06_NODE_24519_length_660_cov_0.994652_1_plen_90_part_00